MTTQFVKVSLVDRVVDAVHDRIADGLIAPGETVRVESLAREFGISRTPVREAISKLEAQGVVVRRSGYAPRIFMPRRRDVLEYYEMRIVLEPLAARVALPEVTRALEKKLSSLTDAMDTFEAPNWFRFNREFHRTLYEAAERPYLVDTIDNLIARSDPYIRIYFKTHDLKETQDGHRRILAGVESRDDQELTAAIIDHLEHAASEIVRLIDDDTDETASRDGRRRSDEGREAR